jgi:hypothetical protein
MIKRFVAAFALATALVVAGGSGVADARPHSHIHGFQQCMEDARAAFRAAKQAGGDRGAARINFHDAQRLCRQNFQHPRGA